MRFSVTIPAYKRTYLKECIDSILAQTYTDFELIIVNDASPEDLDSIVNQYNDSRIRYYINEKNCGAVDVVDNWNICLSYAIGDYVICMGDDDMLSQNALEEYDRLINKYPDVDLFHSQVKLINEKGYTIKTTDLRPEWESVLSMIWNRMCKGQQYIGDFLYRRQLLVEKGGFYKLPLAWFSDEISANIIAEKNGVVNTQNPTFYYRVNQQTITKSGNRDIKMNSVLRAIEWYKMFINSYVPQTNNDLELLAKIKCNLCKYYRFHKSMLISNDMLISFSSLFSWGKKRNEYHLEYIDFAYSLLLYIKKKIF